MASFNELAPKSDVNYRAATDLAESCSKCSSYTAPNQCSTVVGPVDPSFTCDKLTSEEETPAEDSQDTAPEDSPGDN